MLSLNLSPLIKKVIAVCIWLLLPGCHGPTTGPQDAAPAKDLAIDERPAPSEMPEPQPAPALANKVAAFIETHTAQARQRYENQPLNEAQQRERDLILALWSGTYRWRMHSEPRTHYDPAMLWAVCFDIASDRESTHNLNRLGHLLKINLLTRQAIEQEQHGVARVLSARALMLWTKEDPADEHARDWPRAFMLMGDHDGLCRWYRWHLHQRRAERIKSSSSPRTLAQLNEDMAEQWMRLARMESDQRALAAWARVRLTPKAVWAYGAFHPYKTYAPKALQDPWRAVWQAWVFDASPARQAAARLRFLEAVERSWQEEMLLKINANSGKPVELEDADQAELDRCAADYRKRWPNWSIRPFRPGPFDAEQARLSQERLKEAWQNWVDSLVDDHPAADVQAYLIYQQRLLDHLKDINRVDDYYFTTKNRRDCARQFLTFDLEGLLAIELIHRSNEAHLKVLHGDDVERQRYRHQRRIEPLRREGDYESILFVERRTYSTNAPAYGTDHYTAVIEEAAKNLDTHYFIYLTNRHFEKIKAPKSFYPWHYR